MNPDGVVCGNYRNSLAGVDLNRQWINPEKNFHPEVCAVKDLMQAIKEEDKRHIWIYCDCMDIQRRIILSSMDATLQQTEVS